VTIALALAVPDGIALAADTQTTWNQSILKVREKGTGREVEVESPILLPIGWSRLARKLFSLTLGERTFGVAVAGAALLNNKAIFSIFKSLEQGYTGSHEYDVVLQFLCDGLKDQLRKQLGVTDLSQASQIIDVSFILAGYEDQDISRPLLRAVWVYSGRPAIPGETQLPGHQITWQNSAQNRFNCCWVGRGEFVGHVVNHNNAFLPPMTGQYALMTLADAVDYVRFLAEFTCDFQRFAVMVPDCGRPVVTATLDPDYYTEHVATGA
jgi:hypothetical protein